MKSMAKFFYCTWIVFLIFSGVLTSESYKVEKGDTLFSISRTYGITVDDYTDSTRNGGFGSTDKKV